MMIGGILMLAYIRPTLVLTVIAILLLFILPLVLIGRRVRALSRASQDRLADSSAMASEVLTAIPVVQSFGQEARESDRFNAASETTFRTAVRRTRMRSLLTGVAIAAVFGANLYGLYVGRAGRDGRTPVGGHARPDRAADRDHRLVRRGAGGSLGRPPARSRRERTAAGTAARARRAVGCRRHR